MVFGFRCAKIIGICSVVCSKGFKNIRKHRLNETIFGVDKNATISSVATCNNKEEEEEERQEEERQEEEQHEEEEEEERQEEEEEEEKEKHTQHFDKKICGRIELSEVRYTL